MEKASRLAVSIDEQETPSHVVARVIRCLAEERMMFRLESLEAGRTIKHAAPSESSFD